MRPIFVPKGSVFFFLFFFGFANTSTTEARITIDMMEPYPNCIERLMRIDIDLLGTVVDQISPGNSKGCSGCGRTCVQYSPAHIHVPLNSRLVPRLDWSRMYSSAVSKVPFAYLSVVLFLADY